MGVIIDLRDDFEVDASPYQEFQLSNIRYVRLPLNPQKPKDELPTDHHVVYRYYAEVCKPQINTFIKILIESNKAVLLHCFAGRDRTGCFAQILHMALDTPTKLSRLDYEASGADLNYAYLQSFIDAINEQGGISTYLESCGISKLEIEKLKVKYLIEQ